MTLYWVTVKDFGQWIRYGKNGLDRSTSKQRTWNLIRLFGLKIIYFTYVLVLPIMFLPVPAWQVVVGFLLLHAVAGTILSVVFQLAHVVENTTYPIPDEKGNIENDWAVHQLATTADFARNNPIITFYVGGLNYQAIHHLFPRICHVHYPDLAPIVAETAKEFGVPYIYNESFSSAFASHIRTLNKLGRSEISFMAIANEMG
jgi:linoleoyl-CoA desaturase